MAVRDGAEIKGPTGSVYDTRRDFWISSNHNDQSHCHSDLLNLGLEAYGMNFAPDLGYPTDTTINPERMQWTKNTVSHNTVVVDNTGQGASSVRGYPKHLDDAGKIKVMDVSAPHAYGATSEYRRTVVMIQANEEVSYALDFFRIVGGTDHLYSFHSMSNEVELIGVDTVAQTDGEGNYVGSYAGADMPFGEAPTGSTHVASGYSWLKDVRRADNPGIKSFAADFKVTDFGKSLSFDGDFHLRLTMLNDFEAEEISVATGLPPQTVSNIDVDKLEYLLVRNKSDNGQKLESVFTSVIEPYNGERYIAETEEVSAVIEAGSPGVSDAVRAVKVTFADGRVDYVIYATNNKATYKIDDSFLFRGFVGVYSLKDGEVALRYVCDGDIIGKETGKTAAYTGLIESFTTELAFENSITMLADQDVEPEELAGRMVVVENDGTQNAAYLIESAQTDGRRVTLHLGNSSLIRSYANQNDINAGYVYNIARGQRASIALSSMEDAGPVLPGDGRKYTATAGKKFTAQFNAVSPTGKTVAYRLSNPPRGVDISESGLLSWTPNNNQIGTHSIMVIADDGVGMTEIVVDVTVVQGSGSGGGTSSNSPSPGNEGSNTGNEGSENNGSQGSENNGTNGESVGNETTGERFNDLGGHSWAKDAIYRLVDAGVVNGTSYNTYSPAKNITRADFAIMLVRAFGITEGEGENFADVPEGAYYAEELRLAKAAGIVLGIGENKFNPTGEITRQDMMVMLVRALKAVGQGLSEADVSVLAQFADSALVAGYAREAAAQLVSAELIEGSNGKLHPMSFATRAEIAVLLDRILM